MCNLYNLTKGPQAIIDLVKAWNRAGNMQAGDIYPDYPAPIIRNAADGRELVMARWGMPSSQKAILDATVKRADRLRKKGQEIDDAEFAHMLKVEPDAGTTNVRNLESRHWKPWQGVESRCIVPATSFSEYGKERGPDGRLPLHWFATDETQPLFFFAGIWTPWTGVRKAKEGEVTADIYAFLTTEPNAVVAPIHPKAMPVILTEADEIETWLAAPWEEARKLQRPLRDDGLVEVPAPAKAA